MVSFTGHVQIFFCLSLQPVLRETHSLGFMDNMCAVKGKSGLMQVLLICPPRPSASMNKCIDA